MKCFLVILPRIVNDMMKLNLILKSYTKRINKVNGNHNKSRIIMLIIGNKSRKRVLEIEPYMKVLFFIFIKFHSS